MSAPIALGTRMPVIHGRTAIELRGRGAYVLNLEPGRDDHLYSFTPIAPDEGNKLIASDLDMQVMWMAAQRPTNNPPLVYWRIQYSHGETLYDVPQRNSLAAAAPELFLTPWGWVLPQRGLRVRLPAREVRVWFFTPTESPPDDPIPGGAPCTIQVSIQPTYGMEPQRMPLTDLSFGQTPPGNPSQFPLGATEVRFCDPNTGQAVAAGDVQFYDITGVAVGAPVGLATLTDWFPIPLFAAFWVVSADATQASYR